MDNNQIQNEITKSNKTIFYILLGVILLLVIVIILMLLNNNKNAASNIDNSNINNDVMPNNNNYEETNNIEEKNDNKTIEQNRINPDSVPLTSNDFTYVTVNGIPIKFPATKDSFSATGWKWDEKYATRKLDSGTTSSGGRIGNYPGGVVVGVAVERQIGVGALDGELGVGLLVERVALAVDLIPAVVDGVGSIATVAVEGLHERNTHAAAVRLGGNPPGDTGGVAAVGVDVEVVVGVVGQACDGDHGILHGHRRTGSRDEPLGPVLNHP